MKKCTQCNVEREVKDFICKKNIIRLTCYKCRLKSFHNNDKNKDDRNSANADWKKNNVQYIQLYNEFHKKHIDVPKEQSDLLFDRIKKTFHIENKVKGVPSRHRKLHSYIGGIIGKRCSVKECGWQPLTEYNYKKKSWDQLRTTCKKCLSEKRKKVREKKNKTQQLNINFKIRQNIHGRIIASLKKYDKKKKDCTIEYLGCTINEFKDYIESLFTEGMSWDKYGIYIDDFGIKKIGFHIDHIIPCCAFDLTNSIEMLLCFNWRNCRPLWGIENIKKGGKFDMKDKNKYVEDMRSIINDKHIENIIEKINLDIEKEKQEIQKIIEERNNRIKKQQLLFNNYIHDQCLEAIQIMFFMYENKITEKDYKVTPFFLMKNKHSRKSGSDNALSKKVCKLSLDGEFLDLYESMNQAAHDNKTFHASISKCCSNPQKVLHSGGFRWCFEENLDIVQHRSRLFRVLKQLLERVPRYKEPKKQQGRPQSEESRKKIAESMKKFFTTDEGKRNKKFAFEKRSITIQKNKSLL